MIDDENTFLDNARRTLDTAANDIDELTSARLRAARLRALDTGRRVPPWRRGWIVVTGGFAAAGLAALVATALLWVTPPTPHAPVSIADADDLELLATQENPDFFDELDFYDWLADHEDV
jgi:hypothetical protein